MLRGKYLSLLFFVFLFHLVRSQDIIYLNNGAKVKAVVKELNVTTVRYKNFDNQDGPMYVANKKDILFIEYQNGTIEIINKEPASILPPGQEIVLPKKEIPKGPYELHYSNKNCIYLNGLALVNSDIAVIYDREIAKSRLSLVLLGAYNLNIQTNYTNRYIQALSNSKKNYDLGVGINYYTQAKRKTQYFVGVMVKCMHYEYVRETEVEENLNGIIYTRTKQENMNNFQVAGLLINGLQFRITPFFTYRAFLGLGLTNKDDDISKALNENGSQRTRSFPKAYLGMCVGYRFY